jgi:DNA-binding MarR family transcriptional regulator
MGSATTTAVTSDRDDDLATLSDSLTVVVRQANLPRSYERLAEAANVRLERSAYPILRAVAFGPVRLSALAADLDVDLSTASRQVRSAEQAGFLHRSADPDDGRAAVIELTPEGLETLKRMRATRHALVAEQLDAWNDDDVAQLARLLQRLAEDFLSPTPPPSARSAGPAPAPGG